MNRIVCGLMSLIFVGTLANGASATDAANGKILAQRWCAACHVVASDQQSANGQAAPFSAIGKTPDLDPAKLALFDCKSGRAIASALYSEALHG